MATPIEGFTNDRFYVNTVTAESDRDLAGIRDLFIDYASWLKQNGVDIAFQSYAEEFSTLPGKYALEQGGCLLLARAREKDDTVIGCVALRALVPQKIAEMKRLWVTPRARSLGVGRDLVKCILDNARHLGYPEVKLDTLPFMGSARQMYADFGFEECEPYYETPYTDTVFLSYKVPPKEEDTNSERTPNNQRDVTSETNPA